MARVLIHAGAVALAVLTAGCAEFESRTSSPIGPSTLPEVIPSGGSGPVPGGLSLVGTWNSVTGQAVSGSSCTNLQWQITSQSSNAVAGTFSFECVGGIRASGTASGQINGNDVPYQVAGAGTLPGVATCPFSLSGTARIEGDTLRIPYSGTTCLGPIRGEETLRKPLDPEPPAPAPPTPEPPAPPPPPPGNGYHIGPGPTSAVRAEQVVNATAAEFAHLAAPRPSDSEALAASHELLLRMIWHLRHAGFEAGRQKNPSGAISGDKLTVFADGTWQAYDVFYDVGVAHQQTQVIFFPVFPASPLPDGGIPD